jgi:antitoxin HicB
MNNAARASAFDDFLWENGILEEAEEIALRRVLAWQIEQERVAQGMSKAELARRIGTSRSQLDRILRAEEPGIQLETLERGARALGRRLRLELV